MRSRAGPLYMPSVPLVRHSYPPNTQNQSKSIQTKRTQTSFNNSWNGTHVHFNHSFLAIFFLTHLCKVIDPLNSCFAVFIAIYVSLAVYFSEKSGLMPLYYKYSFREQTCQYQKSLAGLHTWGWCQSMPFQVHSSCFSIKVIFSD